MTTDEVSVPEPILSKLPLVPEIMPEVETLFAPVLNVAVTALVIAIGLVSAMPAVTLKVLLPVKLRLAAALPKLFSFAIERTPAFRFVAPV